MNGEMNQLFEKIGGLDATMRDLKHSNNNLAQKVEGLAVVVARTAALQEAMADHDARIKHLETDKHRRDGAIGLLEWVSKHWPFLGLSGVLIAWIGYANGLLGN